MELQSLPKSSSFSFSSPIVSKRLSVLISLGKHTGLVTLPRFSGTSNMLSVIGQADSIVIVWDPISLASSPLHPLPIQKRRVIVPRPHSSISTVIDCLYFPEYLVEIF